MAPGKSPQNNHIYFQLILAQKNVENQWFIR